MKQLISFDVSSYDASWITSLCSNLRSKTTYSDSLHVSTQSLHINAMTVPEFWSYQLPSKYFLTLYSLIILSFKSTQSQIRSAPLNKPYIYLKYLYITLLCLSFPHQNFVSCFPISTTSRSERTFLILTTIIITPSDVTLPVFIQIWVRSSVVG
jgi:hypothetical protein